MKLFEYEAKQLFAKYGVPIPRGRVVKTAVEAREAARQVGGRVVIKAQIHGGGRGKAGGIKVATNPEEAEKLFTQAIRDHSKALRNLQQMLICLFMMLLWMMN